MDRIAARTLRPGMVYFRLIHHKTIALRGPLDLAVTAGRAWVTVDGRPGDCFLGAGQSFTVPPRGLTVVEADPACVLGLRVEPSRVARPAWHRRVLRSLGALAGARTQRVWLPGAA